MSNTTKIAISLPRELLDKIDKIANSAHCSRSKFIRDCIINLLDEYMNKETLAKAKKFYSEIEESDLELNREFFDLSKHAVSNLKYKNKYRGRKNK